MFGVTIVFHLQVKREHETLETSAALAEFDMLDSLAFVINKISCEVGLFGMKLLTFVKVKCY